MPFFLFLSGPKLLNRKFIIRRFLPPKIGFIFLQMILERSAKFNPALLVSLNPHFGEF